MRSCKIISMLLIFIICLTNASTALEIEGQIEDIELPAIVTEDKSEDLTPKENIESPTIVTEEKIEDSTPKEDNVDLVDESLITDDKSLITDNQNEFVNVNDIDELKIAIELNPERIQIQDTIDINEDIFIPENINIFRANGFYGNLFCVKSGKKLILEGTVIDAAGDESQINTGSVIKVDKDGYLEVNNSSFFGNSTNTYGGVIYNGGKTIISNTTFQNNKSTKCGGAICNLGEMTIENSYFNSNYSINEDGFSNSQGGAIYNEDGVLKISITEFINNVSSEFGGAIYSKKSFELSKTKFENNVSLYNGEDSIKSDAIYSEMGLKIFGEATEVDQSIYSKEEFINDSDLLYIKSPVFLDKLINNKKIKIEDKIKTNLVENNSIDTDFEISQNSSIEIIDSISGNILNNGNIYLKYCGNLDNEINGDGTIIYDNSGELQLSINTQNSIQIKDGTVVSGTSGVSVKNIILNGGVYRIKNVVESDLDTKNENLLYIKSDSIIGNGNVEIEINDNIKSSIYYYIGDYNNIENTINFKFKNSFGLEQLLPAGFSKKLYSKENSENYIILKNYALEGYVYEFDGISKSKNVMISIGNKNVYVDKDSFYKIEGFDANDNKIKITADGISIWENINFDTTKNKNIILPKRFYISGKITDENGIIAKDVLVKVGSKKVNTDSNGYYKIQNIIGSEISVEPEKLGYIFSPTYKRINLKEDTQNIDFIMKPDPNFNTSLGNKWTDEGIYDEIYYNDVNKNYDKMSDFYIDTPQKLASISKLSNIFNFKNKNIILINDIDLANYQWDPISKYIDFAGNFDGQNHIIKNLTIGSNKISDIGPRNAGLFSILSNNVICKNIVFENVYINSSAYNVGVLSGFVNSADIININILSGKIKGGVNSIGGIAGTAESIGFLSQCIVNVAIDTGTPTTGGLIGSINKLNTIKSSAFKGSIYSRASKIGGIVGIIKDGNSIINTYSEGLLEGAAGGSIYEWGGIGGNCKLKEVCNVYSNMSIFGILTSEIGVFGILKSDENLKLDHIYQYGNLYGTYHAGGIAGCINAKTINASNLYVFGYVKGNTVGGLFGYGEFQNFELTNSGVLGEIVGGMESNEKAGYFIGFIKNNLKENINIYAKNNFYLYEYQYKDIGYNEYYSIPSKYIRINDSNEGTSIFENLIDFKNNIEKGDLSISLKPKFIEAGINAIIENIENNVAYDMAIDSENRYKVILREGYKYFILKFPIYKIVIPEIKDNGIEFPEGYNKSPSSKSININRPIIKGTIDYRNENILLPNINTIKLNGKTTSKIIDSNLVFDIKDIIGTNAIFNINTNLFRYNIPFRPEPPKGLKITKTFDGMYYQIENLDSDRLCEYSFDGGIKYTLIKTDSNGLIVIPRKNLIESNGIIPNFRIRYADTEKSFKSVAYGDTTLGSEAPAIIPIDSNMLEVKFYKNDMSGEFFIQYVKKGEKIKEPNTLKRNGYKFIGWYKDSKLTDNGKWNFNDAITENKSLYAKWSADKKLINPELENKEYIYDKTIKEVRLNENNLRLNENIDYKITYVDKIGNIVKPIESGTYIVKFELTERGNSKYYTDSPVESELKILPKLALIKWSGNEVRRFDGNKSDIKAEVLNLEKGDICKIEVENGDQVGDKYTIKTYIAKIASISNSNYIISNNNITEYTIIPKELRYYIVTFKDMYGNNIESMNIEEDEEIIPPKEPEEKGYKFIGWYTELKEGEVFNDFASIKKDMILYARYEKIIIDENGNNRGIDTNKDPEIKEEFKYEEDNKTQNEKVDVSTELEPIKVLKPVSSKLILKDKSKEKQVEFKKNQVKLKKTKVKPILLKKIPENLSYKSSVSKDDIKTTIENTKNDKLYKPEKAVCKMHSLMIIILMMAFIIDIYFIKRNKNKIKGRI